MTEFKDEIIELIFLDSVQVLHTKYYHILMLMNIEYMQHAAPLYTHHSTNENMIS